MALSIIGDCQVQGSQGVVVIEGDNITEVNSSLAKAAALQAAAGRMNKPGISGQSGPFAVDPNGNSLAVSANGMPQAIPRGARWRQEFKIQAGL